MLNILIVSHGKFAEGIKDAASMILGKNNISVVGLKAGVEIENFEKEVEETYNRLSNGNDYVIVFTDMMGGTPFNVVSKLMIKYKFIHFTGLNLPILLEVCSKGEGDGLNDVIESIEEVSRKSILFVNDIFDCRGGENAYSFDKD